MATKTVEEFLEQHWGDLVTVIEKAQQKVGGHYAKMSPQQLHTNALADTREFYEALRLSQVDKQNIRDSARKSYENGISLDDLLALIDTIEPFFIAFVDEEMEKDPGLIPLRSELLRRMKHLNTSFRSNIATVKLDIAMDKLSKPF